MKALTTTSVRSFLSGHGDGAGAVDRVIAVEDRQWIGDGAAAQMLFHLELLAQHGTRVECGPEPRVQREGPIVLSSATGLGDASALAHRDLRQNAGPPVGGKILLDPYR
ncbi:hypothetical protein EP51_43010 (plasmid) [Rhodococcus opacus]|uniref:Uncharacterized protein n=1 Tax=Rhodococcus opacus TaxID=37919 RepID=A0A076EY89_RHOOP|nr:hypothetical protein EP51_43010 [Rhodococcus opacus]